MIAFLIGAAILLVLSLYPVLQPLAAGSRRVAAGVALGVIVASTALYLHLGTPAALDPAATRAPTTLAEARTQLERKLKDSPDDAVGWQLLGRAYTAEGNAAEAAKAHAEAARLAPNDPEVLAEAAEASAMAQPEHRFDGAAVGQLRKALEIDPTHQRARWFLGVSQRQAGEHAQAAETWMPLLSSVDPQTAGALRTQINEAREAAGLEPLAVPKTAQASAGLRIEVALAPALARTLKASPQAQVFVLARAAGGPPMPIAVQRHPLAALPLSITLTDADGPMPTMKLSGMKEVEVVARISMQGTADRQPGDIESAPVKTTLPARDPLKLVIGKE